MLSQKFCPSLKKLSKTSLQLSALFPVLGDGGADFFRLTGCNLFFQGGKLRNLPMNALQTFLQLLAGTGLRAYPRMIESYCVLIKGISCSFAY